MLTRLRRPTYALALLGVALVMTSTDSASAGSGGSSEGPGAERPPAVLAQEDTILASDPAMVNRLAGAAVAIDGDLILVGIPQTPGALAAGVVRHARRDASSGLWVEPMMPITCPVIATGTCVNFGASIALLGDTAVIGAPGLNGPGSAYLFTYDRVMSSWVTIAPQLLVRPPEAVTRFGYSVAISAERIAVGSPGSGTGSTGRVFVYERAGLAVSVIRGESHGATSASLFGGSVALGTDTVLVGAPAHDRTFGAAFSFRHEPALADGGPPDGGTLPSPWEWSMAGLLAPVVIPNADFGRSLALSSDGRTALIGAPGADPGTTATLDNAGAAFLYTRASTTALWGDPVRIEAETARGGAAFGWSVDLTDDAAWLAIGARGFDDAGLDQLGTVYLLPRAVMPETARFFANGGAALDRLGSAVSISGSTIVAGAAGDGTHRSYAAVFPFPAATGTACSLDGRCLTGFCVDGFCCDVACGGSEPGDCTACSTALGASVDGTCGPVRAAEACTSPCGPGTCGAGSCVATEMCDAGPPPIDVGPDFDAGPPRRPPVVRISGCRCGVGTASAPSGLVALGVGLAFLVAMRRRR